MKEETNVERFYAWMRKINSIHLADNAKMAAVFHKVACKQQKQSKQSLSTCETLWLLT